jgi:hypothetical protein
MKQQLGSDTIATSVWLDEQGLIRRELLDLTLNIEGEPIDASVRMTFSDFSDRHEVALPDEADVKDVTGEWERYKVHFTG